VEKGDRIAELSIEKIDNRELQEVAQFDDTKRGGKGFGRTDTTKDQEVTGQSAITNMDQEVKGKSSEPQIEINEISGRALQQFYRRGETTGILRSDEI